MEKISFVLFLFIFVLAVFMRDVSGKDSSIDKKIVDCKSNCYDKNDGIFVNAVDLRALCHKQCCNEFRPLPEGGTISTKDTVNEKVKSCVGRYDVKRQCAYYNDVPFKSQSLIAAVCYEICEKKYKADHWWGNGECKFEWALNNTLQQYRNDVKW